MRVRSEVVHHCAHRVFDLESYERTAEFGELLRDRDSGYYVLISMSEAGADGACDFSIFGPFPHVQAADAVADSASRGAAVATAVAL